MKNLNLLGERLEENKISDFNKFPRFNKKTAFSIAEAFITLAIVGLALGAAAPLISKSMKNSQVSNLQLQYLQKQIDDLKTKTLQSGAIVFFAGNCPTGWTDMSNSYAGRYVRIAGKYEICDKTGEDTDGTCKNKIKERTIATGSLEGESLRRIWGTFPGNDADYTEYMDDWAGNSGKTATQFRDDYVEKMKSYKFISGAFDYLKSEEASDSTSPFALPTGWENKRWTDNPTKAAMYRADGTYLNYTDVALLSWTQGDEAFRFFQSTFDSARQVPTDTTNDELRPKTVVLKACKVPD